MTALQKINEVDFELCSIPFFDPPDLTLVSTSKTKNRFEKQKVFIKLSVIDILEWRADQKK